jgi:alpha-1,3/alpha-1,6-mannosyltransferase
VFSYILIRFWLRYTLFFANVVFTGGYDPRVHENVSYHTELVQLATSLKLKSTTSKNVVTALGVPDDIEVLFLLSIPNSLKDALLKSARLLVYTPSNEHFGIVPLEAMLAGTPVLAANTGGPLETIVDGVTGWLCPPDEVERWTQVMDRALHKMSEGQLREMAAAGRERVIKEFSEVKMAERLDGIIQKMNGVPRRSTTGMKIALAILGTVPAVWLAWLLTYGICIIPDNRY